MRESGRGAAWVFGAFCMLAGCASHRPPPPSADIEETGFRDAVRLLASDAFEGRRPGTPGEEKTVDFLTEQFRKLGLKPGNGDSYVQQVPLVEILPARPPSLTVMGRGSSKQLVYAKDMVIWTRRAVLEAGLQHSELVFVGYGIVAPEYGWNDYSGVDAHGKTVVVLVNDPGYGSKDPKVFRGNTQTYYGRWTYKVEEAARQGAAGVLMIHDARAAGQDWHAVVSEGTQARLEPAVAEDHAPGAAIEGWLSGDAAQALFAQAQLDLGALTAAAARPGFTARPLGLDVDAAVHDSVRRLSSANMIAVLPGSKRKNEYVIYSAHWDHLGHEPAERGGAIFAGAVDNASGVAGLLMLAQSFSRTRPVADRSIAFIAFTAKEDGLLGSAYYVEHPVLPLRDTVAVLNLDSLRIGGPTRDVMVFGYANSELEEYLADAALLQGRVVHADPTPEQGFYYRSDQFSFARSGIPALYAKGGIDDAARGPVWGQAQLDDFNMHRDHQPSDKYSADWDVRGTLDDLRVYYEIGGRLARTRHFPRWYPNSEFSGRYRNPQPLD